MVTPTNWGPTRGSKQLILHNTPNMIEYIFIGVDMFFCDGAVLYIKSAWINLADCIGAMHQEKRLECIALKDSISK